MKQNLNICSLCLSSKVRCFQLRDSIRPPDDLQFEGCTELHGALEKILELVTVKRNPRFEVCQKCHDEFRKIYSFLYQCIESKKIFCKLKETSVQLKKLKVISVDINIKKEYEECITSSELECSSLVENIRPDGTTNSVSSACGMVIEGTSSTLSSIDYFEAESYNKSEWLEEEYSNDYEVPTETQGLERYENGVPAGIEGLQQHEMQTDIIEEERVINEIGQFETHTGENLSDTIPIATLAKRVHAVLYECDLCNAKFRRLQSFNAHKQTHSQNSKIFECDVCHAKFDSKTDFLLHKRRHKHKPRQTNVFQCDQCDEKFPRKSRLWYHKRKHGIPIKCDLCNASYFERSSLKRHIQNAHIFSCDKCGVKCKTLDRLKFHKKMHSLIFYQCNRCNATFKSRSDFESHKLKCNESETGLNNAEDAKICGRLLTNGRIKCNQCNAQYSSMRSLRQHVRVHHGKKIFSCDQCDAKFNTSNFLRFHQRTHTDGVFKCEKCDAKFKRKNNFKTHKLTHIISMKCDVCKAEFTSIHGLRIHKISHSRVKFKCEQCVAGYFTRGALNRHVQMVHTNKNFSCDQCDSKFNTFARLTAHKRTHTNTLLQCNQCSMKFKDKNLLTIHKRVHTEKLPLKCDKCDQTIKGVIGFTRHMLSHRIRLPFKCDQCDKRFKSVSGFRCHKLSHRIRSFKCDQCDKIFNSISGFRTHKRSHRIRLPLKCDQCDAKFQSVAGYKSHKISHLVTLKCDVCDAKFKSTGGLKVHKLSHTGVSYNCKQCNGRFYTTYSLNRHLRTVHKSANI